MFHLSRRTSRVAGLAVLISLSLALTACAATPTPESSDPASGDSTGAFPVSIDHAFGETTIDAKPERVVTWGWGSADAALALGVVPVAIPFQGYGGDKDGVLPWIADALTEQGAELPVVLPDSAEEPPYEAIAAAAPDVILAAYSGITAEQYDLLSAIAPTVAYPGEAWSTPWRDLVTIVGEALGEADAAADVLARIDGQIAEQAAEHPELVGKTIAAVWDVAGTFYVYKEADPRVEFMLGLGLESAPSVDALASGDSSFYYTLSYEELDRLDADIIVSYSDTQAEADAFAASSYGRAIPAVAAGAIAPLVGTEFIASVSPPTALSLPWGLDQLVGSLSAAAGAR